MTESTYFRMEKTKTETIDRGEWAYSYFQAANTYFGLYNEYPDTVNGKYILGIDENTGDPIFQDDKYEVDNDGIYVLLERNPVNIETPKEAKEGRRYKMLRIQPDVILDLIRGEKSRHYKRILIDSQLPDDASIDGVFYQFERNLFLIRVHSETFDIVPTGAIPDDVPVIITTG